MVAEQERNERVEELKKQGNEFFQKNQLEDAIQAYTRALQESSDTTKKTNKERMTKVTLLSNRAACRLKQDNWEECVVDCTLALKVLDSPATSGGDGDGNINEHTTTTATCTTTTIRCKILYRRSKAWFMADHSSPNQKNLNDAARDLLTLISIDKNNEEAAALLRTIRAKHGLQQKDHTPVAKTLGTIQSSSEVKDKIHHLKVLLGLLNNDTASTSMEIGRRDGVLQLMQLLKQGDSLSTAEETTKIRTLGLQVVSCACSHPPFVWTYCGPRQGALDQPTLARIISEECQDGEMDVAVAALSVMLRLVLHLDNHDEHEHEQPHEHADEKKEQIMSSRSNIDETSVCHACISALSSNNVRMIKTTLDVLSSWITTDHWGVVQAVLVDHAQQQGGSNKSTMASSGLPYKATPDELRAMKPREVASYKRQEYLRKERDKAWAKSRSLLFCDMETGGLEALLQCAVDCPQHSVLRDVSITLGRIMGSINDDLDIKTAVAPIFGCTNLGEESKEVEGLTIEEIHDDDDIEKFSATNDNVADEDRLNLLMERGQLASALLLGKPELGVWALSSAWSDGQGLTELREMMLSDNNRAMFIASEIISAAASIEKGRPLISGLVESRAFQNLLENEDREIQSGAASAIAKVGLADKALSSNEGEVVGLLQVALSLLEDSLDDESAGNLLEGTAQSAQIKPSVPELASASTATTAVERGLELMGYLTSKTLVKEELAHGFRAPGASTSALEKLVEFANVPGAGESVSAYAIATIFASLAVSIDTLRKEAFDGKELSAEQYEELQALGKTEEEKELENNQTEHDLPQAVNERIRKMASNNVPRAIVNLMNGASERTQELLITVLNRMATEKSVRGLMVQQGALSACIKFENGENPSESAKKTLQYARHSIGKLLVTMNPSLLTASQRMGSIKPLIQLIRDHDASDLQRFEGLLAVTNLASIDENKDRIVAENGVSTLSYGMYSEHEMVRRAATEAMCNLVPHPAMMKHLADPEHLRLWVAFASDYEQNFECARASAGCLAMATPDPKIALAFVGLKTFKEATHALLECGNLELMHRALVVILNLLNQDEKCRKAVLEAGLVKFCTAYVASYHDGSKMGDLDFSDADKKLIAVTLDLAKEVVRTSDKVNSGV